MADEGEKTNSVFWLGVILGGLIGAAVTYLAAADDKDELKRNLVKKGKILLKNLGEFKEDVEEKVQQIPEAAQEAVEKVQAEIQVHQKARKFFLSKGKPLVKK